MLYTYSVLNPLGMLFTQGVLREVWSQNNEDCPRMLQEFGAQLRAYTVTGGLDAPVADVVRAILFPWCLIRTGVVRHCTGWNGVRSGVSSHDSLVTQGGVMSISVTKVTICFFLLAVAAMAQVDRASLNSAITASSGGINASSVQEEPQKAGVRLRVNLASVAEFRVNIANNTAEYGDMGGAQANVVTKSGANQFHGDVFEFLRNETLDTRSPFDPSKVPPVRLKTTRPYFSKQARDAHN